MIQRIQTVYLFVSALLIGLLFFLPFAEIIKDGSVFQFNWDGIASNGALNENSFVFPFLIGFILVAHFLAILSFKNRSRQIQEIVVAIVFQLCLFGMFFFQINHSFNGFQVSYKISMAFPLVAIVIDYLAIRAIKKDEALIRSIDRIR